MKYQILVLVLLMSLAAGCGPSAEEQVAMTATVQTATAASWTKTPTITYTPTSTSTQTPVPTPTETLTPIPTNTQTPIPTELPLPGMQQVNDDGFGNPNNLSVFALEVFQGFLYAGTRNEDTGCEIWRYDGSSWESVMNGCFGKPYNLGIDDFIVYNGRLYAGVWTGANEDGTVEGGEIWRSNDGRNWEEVVSGGFGFGGNYPYIDRLIEFKNYLYAVNGDYGTPEFGLEIWRSKSGNNGEWVKVVTGGFGKLENMSIVASAIFKEKLYVGTFTLSGTAQVYSTVDGEKWESVNDFNLGGINNRRVSALDVFNGYLYAAVIETGELNEIIARVFRCQICDGDDWELVLDGPYEYPGTYRKPGLEVYGDYLYYVVGNYYDLGNDIKTKGLELWRTGDGSAWERLAYGGFNDENNAWTYFDNAMVVYDGNLYIGLDNKATGAEVWMVSE
jgi:hypothetical protein